MGYPNQQLGLGSACGAIIPLGIAWVLVAMTESETDIESERTSKNIPS